MLKKVLKNISKYIEKNYGQVILILILITMCILSFKYGEYILHNDNYSAELNPSLSLSRYLESPAWRGYRGLGFASDSEQADIFRSVLFTMFEGILPSWLTGQIFYSVCLFVGSISIGMLVSKLVSESKLKKYKSISFLLAGTTYATTLWTMWTFYQSMAPYVANYGFLPLLLLAVYQYTKEQKITNLLFLFISSLLLTSVSVIATLFITNFILLFSFILFLNIFSTEKGKILRILKTLAVFLLTQLFWILPFIYYTITTSQDIIGSYTNRTITSSIIDLESDMQNPLNSARFFNRSLFELDGEEYLFPMAEEFQTYDFYKVLGLLPAFFSILALVFGVWKKNRKLLFWGGIALVSWFLIKVVNPPLSGVFVWIQENIPLFKQVFRWPFSKLGEVYLIAVTILSTFGILYFHTFLSSFIKGRTLKKIFLGLSFFFIILLQLIYSEYIFRGDIYPKRAIVDLPSTYFELENYISENNLDGRIYYAPPANNNYFREYSWGFWGSQFISYILPNPMMDLSSAIGSALSEKAMIDTTAALRAKDSEKLLSLLQKYNVEYVLLDESQNADGFSFNIDVTDLKNMLSKYEKTWNSEFLTLYKVPHKEDVKYVESLSNSDFASIFIRDIPLNPIMYTKDMDIQDIRVEGSEIKGEFTYKGFSTYVYSNLDIENIAEYPSNLQLKNGIVKVSPSTPYIVGDKTKKPFKLFNTPDSPYYSVEEVVLTKDQLKDGVSVSTPYSSLSNIYGINEESFTSTNFIPKLLETKGSDCSGGVAVENTAVTGEEISSGFNLKGSSELPCVYTNIELRNNQAYVLKLKLNWESKRNNYPGFCIYSEDRKTCLNKEKFLYSDSFFGEKEILLDTVVKANERIALILYTIDTSSDFTSETLFREVTVKSSPIVNPTTISQESDVWKKEDIFLEDMNKYTLSIPFIYGSDSYLYDSISKKGLMWHPNRPDAENRLFEISADNGISQKVEDDYINHTVNLFKTEPSTNYLIYWNGENISNIPSDICVIYEKEKKCWYQEMFFSNTKSSLLDYFESDTEEKQLNTILGSTSYKLVTENKLNQFVMMKYPSIWETFTYSQESIPQYKEIELERVFNSVNSTFYKGELSNNEATLVSIPQAHATGWIAFGKKGWVIQPLSKEKSVSIDGWKQGWDISNTSFESIHVIYWPNILSYLGYVVIFGMSLYILIKVLEKRKK